MVMNLYSAFILIYSNVLYKQVIYGWDQTSAYTGAVGNRYQFISDFAQRINEWNEDWPQQVCGFFFTHNRIVWTVKGCETGPGL